jgi:hypothetical protein
MGSAGLYVAFNSLGVSYALTGAKLALDDNIVPYLFVRITWVDLFD